MDERGCEVGGKYRTTKKDAASTCKDVDVDGLTVEDSLDNSRWRRLIAGPRQASLGKVRKVFPYNDFLVVVLVSKQPTGWIQKDNELQRKFIVKPMRIWSWYRSRSQYIYLTQYFYKFDYVGCHTYEEIVIEWL